MTIIADIDWRRCAFAHSSSLMIMEFTGLYISPKRMSEIIGTQLDDEHDNPKYEPYDSNDGSMDTCVRDRVMDCVSKHYLGIPWPSNIDNINMNDFKLMLENAVEDSIQLSG